MFLTTSPKLDVLLLYEGVPKEMQPMGEACLLVYYKKNVEYANHHAVHITVFNQSYYLCQFSRFHFNFNNNNCYFINMCMHYNRVAFPFERHILHTLISAKNRKLDDHLYRYSNSESSTLQLLICQESMAHCDILPNNILI